MSEAPTPAVTQDEKHELSRSFLNAVFSLLKGLAIHGIDNEAVRRPVEQFVQTLDSLIRLRAKDRWVEFKFQDGAIYVNDHKVNPHFSIVEALKLVPDHMEVAMYEALIFKEGFGPDDIGDFFTKWAMHVSLHGKPKKLEYQNPRLEIRFVDPNKAIPGLKTRALLMDPMYALKHYYFLRGLVVDFFKGFTAGDVKPQREIRRELLEITDIINVAPYQVVALSLIKPEIKEEDDVLSSVVSQAISTSLLSMVLARELGYSIREQVNLGMVGLLYNIGLLGEASAIISKKDRLTQDEYKKVIDAQSSAIFKLIRAQGATRPVLERLLAIFENAKGGLKDSVSLTLESRMLRLVSQYIALINKRPYRDAYTPHEAIKILGSKATAKGQSGLDPILFYVFVRFMGYIPVGSLCLLSNQKKGIVYRPSGESLGTPLIKMLPEEGSTKSFLLDLSNEEKLEIVKTLDPDHEGIQVSGFFFE